MKNYLKLMRIKHYIKNFLIFLPLVFSKNLFDFEKVIPCILGFLAFCMVSSTIYVLNDIADVEKDRAHPVKKNRPIASGIISVKAASVCGVFCFILSIVFQIFAKHFLSYGVLVLYFVLNIAYSFWLKKKPFWDVIILVSGFYIRILYGSLITGVAISSWLYLTIISAAFYMAFGKRRNELKKTSDETRDVLRFYSYDFLNNNMYMCMGIANVFYSLWAMENGNMLATVPLVLLLSMRYSYDIEKEESQGNPVDVILHDKMFLLLAAIYGIYVLASLYLIK